jgi:Flp pilus assembly protein TadB
VVAQLGRAQEELGGGPGGRGWGVNFAGDCGALFLFFLLVLLVLIIFLLVLLIVIVVLLLLLTLGPTLLRQVGGSEREPQSEEWLVCGGREVGLLKASC